MTDLSRRGLFGRLLGRVDPEPESKAEPSESEPQPTVSPSAAVAGAAVAGKPSGIGVGRPRPGPMRPAKAGLFAIANHLCLAWQGTSCSTCRERCPVPGAVRVEAGRPTIDPALCTGCGDCVAVCPAPILAIRFVPKPATSA